MEEAQEAIGEIKGLRRGHLHVGASTTPGVYLLPRIIGELKVRYRGIEVFLEIAKGKLSVIPVRGLSLKRPLFILSHRDKRPLPLVVAFLECARSVKGLLQ